MLLVNDAFVRTHLKGADPIGRRLLNFRDDGDAWQIIGVIGDVHTRGLDRAPAPLAVVTLAQWPVRFVRVAVRTEGPPLQAAPLLRAALRALDPDLPMANAQLLDRVVVESVGERRFQMLLLSAFGLVALVLASLGIYGVLANSVAQRTREIGIRMALGAKGSQVLRIVIASGLELAAVGVAAGIACALALTRALQAALYGVSATDPLTFAAVSALILAVAALASWVPARRATRVDPALPLRAE